mgnify:CR=1 FL=1
MITNVQRLALKKILLLSFSLAPLFCLGVNAAIAACQPSDPFGTNPNNICPKGFAFAFTQNFESPHYVRGKLFMGSPTGPGIPGVLVEEINGFYTGVSTTSQGLVRITSTGDTKTYKQANGNQVRNEVREQLEEVPR